MSDRPLFDPLRIRGPAPPGGPGEAAPGTPPLYSVRQLNELVRGLLLQHLPATVHVLGEIAGVSRPASGHLYFALQDAGSELQCVLWRSAAGRLRFRPEPGMQVIATGSLDVYTPRGTYQLYVRALEPRGVGLLEVAFRQLKERLEREGLFDPARKKPIPRIPQRIALVTSPTGAAIRDIIQTLRRRFAAIQVLLFPVRVQGEGAALEIADAIRQMNASAAALGGIDVAIVGRGGGSPEDLWAFNEEPVARAIAASQVPIVSAVGHEIDVSISDLVADLRAATPTAAAELIAPPADELREFFRQRMARAARCAAHQVALGRARLRALLAYDGLARPLVRLRERAQRVDELQQRLHQRLLERVRAVRARLSRAELVILQFRAGQHFRRLSARLAQRVARLQQALSRPVLAGEHRLARQLARLQRAAPDRRLARDQADVRHLAGRAGRAMQAALSQQHGVLQARLDTLAAYDPQRVLRRGYSITRDARTGRIIRSVQEIRDRQRLTTQVADGEFKSTAEDPRQPQLFD